MPEFSTATGTLFYEVQGPDSSALPADAPTLTLLHNFTSTGMAWGHLLPALRTEYRVLVPDMPGHGRSQGYPENFDHTEMARQIALLMHMEGADTGHLAGCSSGGMVAQLLVEHKLVKPHTLTLVSTTHSTNPETTNNHASITPENFKAGRNWMEATAKLHDPYHYAGYYNEVLLPGFRQLRSRYAIDLPLAALQTWTVPVCIIQGEQDEFFPPFVVQAMAAALPDAELHLVPDQTHGLIFRQPWKVRDLMLDFLRRHPS